MDIIAICGSPRKGNTEYALKRFLVKAEELGNKVELVLLREKRIERCSGCMACEKTGECGMRDDMNGIIERLKANDLIVFGSANYFNNVTGLMKDFFDRLDPLYGEKPLSGKKMIAVYAGAQPQLSEKAMTPMQTMANSMEMELVGALYVNGTAPGDVEKDDAQTQKIDGFANDILANIN